MNDQVSASLHPGHFIPHRFIKAVMSMHSNKAPGTNHTNSKQERTAEMPGPKGSRSSSSSSSSSMSAAKDYAAATSRERTTTNPTTTTKIEEDEDLATTRKYSLTLPRRMHLPNFFSNLGNEQQLE